MAEDAEFTVIVELRAVAEAGDEVLSELRRNARDSAAEPGCLEFTILRDTADELEFVLYERYRNEHAFRVEHLASEHYARWKSAAARLVAVGSQRRRELRVSVGDGAR